MSDTADSRAFNGFTPLRFGLLLALLIFAMFPQVLLGVQTFVVRDYAFFAYPLAHFQRECFWHGQLPLWDPYNDCGTPFLAQWNTMPLYPGALIYLLLPLSWSLSFFCLLHLWFAGFGMYQLARRWTGGNFAAAFAGVAFAFNGLTLNLLMWPSHIATFSWMPWVVLTVEAAWREGGRKIAIAALAGAMQMLAGGPETILLTWLLLSALWLQQLLVKGDTPRGPVFRRFPFIVTLVAALSAAQLLPFLDLASHSGRHGDFAGFRWSMPAWGWMNFLVPMTFGGYSSYGVFFQRGQEWTSSYYPGIGALWLAALAVGMVRDRRVRLLAAAAALASVFALGDNTSVYPAVRRVVPQLDLMTYPIKFVLVPSFLISLLAAFALARWTQDNHTDGGGPAPSRAFSRLVISGSVVLAMIAGILFWAWRFPFPGDDVRATLFNGLERAGLLVLTGVLLLAIGRAGLATGWRRLAPLLLIMAAWLDALTHEPAQNPTVPPAIYQLNLARTKLAMDPQPELGGSRAMLSPAAFYQFATKAVSSSGNNFLAGRLAYSADCNLLDAVPKVDSFFSLTPREYDDFEHVIYGSLDASYPRLEDFLGVSQITAPDQVFHWQSRSNYLPLVTAGQKPVFLDADATLRALAQPDFDGSKTVFLPPEAKSSVSVSNQTAARVLHSQFGMQTVDAEIEADKPSLVVVAQTYYHGWRASMDGQSAPLLRANHAFQAVQVPAGRHHVRLVYQDPAFRAGAAISLSVCLGCLLVPAISFLRRRKISENI